MKGMEGRLSAIEVKLKGIKEQLRRLVSMSEESGEREGETRIRSSKWGSEWSVSRRSNSLSVKEIGKLKDMMKERERYERRNNIVIKGIGREERNKVDGKWMEKFIEEITGTPAKVTKCRLSGGVIVATIENNELKENIIKRKGRL